MRLGLIFLLLCALLHANRNAGPYIGVGYSTATTKSDYYNFQDDSAKGYLLYAGAYINKYFCVEIEYNEKMTYTLQNSDTLDIKYIDINTQAHYPIFNNIIDPYVKFGIAQIYTSTSDGFSFLYGLGVRYLYKEMLGLKIGYNYYDAGIDTTNNKSADKKIHTGYGFVAIEVQF
jgi:opacity protein-like surface antigen